MYCCYKKSSTTTISFLIILITLLNFNFCNSQTGPGGVGTNDGSSNLAMWLNANIGVESASGIPAVNGNNVSTWLDQSGKNTNASSVTAPNYATNEHNGYPAIHFTHSSNEYMSIANYNNLPSGNNDRTYIFAAETSNTGFNQTFLYHGSTDASATGYGKRINITNNTNDFSIAVNGHRYGEITSPSTSIRIGAIVYPQGSTSSNQFVNYVNASTLSSSDIDGNNQSLNTDNHAAWIGANRVPSRYYNGDMCEIIIFDRELNDAEFIITHNYISAKYGNTLTKNDLYTQDNTINGNFDHNVAGIGQASDGSNHTDSRGTGIVTINNPSALSNGDYLFWGEDTKDATYTFSTNASLYYEHLDSNWRVSKVNNLGTVTVVFDISGVDLSEKQSCRSLQLVVDNDSDFSSPTSTYDLTIPGNPVTLVNFNDGDYFSLRYIDQIVWDGTNFFNGSEPVTNAPNTSDSCLKLTIKANGTLPKDAHVREVLVEAGATLNIEHLLQVDNNIVLEAGAILNLNSGAVIQVGGDVEIGGAASLNVTDGILLEVDGNIDNDGTINLLGDAQLIQNHTGTTANSGTGNFIIRQQGTGNDTGYNYWSSPVNTLNDSWQIKNLEDGTGSVIPFLPSYNAATPSPITLSSRWLYTFNGPDNYNNWVKIETDTDLAPGIGYTMKGSGSGTDQEYIFRGSPNDGNYSIPVTTGNEILIGNPYPSALDSHEFINNNSTSFDGTLYFWESFSSNNSHYLADYEGGYATYNLMDMGMPAVIDPSGLTSGLNTSGITKLAPTRYVSVGQGFFIKSPVGYNGNIVFNNGQRAFAREILNETVYYKTNNTKSHQAIIEDTRPKLWFSLIDTKGYSKTIGLGYDTNTTLQYDRGYDAEPMDYLKDHMYWVLYNKKLVIQGLPEINTGDILPLAMEVTNPGVFEFSISKMENVPDDLNIYLLDNEQNIYYNLRDDEAQFAINTKGNQNQFSIVLQEQNVLGANKFDKNDAFVSYNSNSKVLELHYTESITTIENLKFYNTLGQEVKNIKTLDSSRIDISHLADGVYILNIETKNGAVLKNIKFAKY